MNTEQILFDILQEYRKKSIQKDKKLVSMCNSIIKYTSDERLLDKAHREKKKALTRLQREEVKEENFFDSVRKIVNYEND